LAAIALLALFGGAALFAALVGVTALLLAWEWAGITRRGADRVGVVSAAGVATAVALAAAQLPLPALAALGVASALAMALARNAAEDLFWAGLGAIWIGLPCVALVWLRHLPAGERLIFWLLLVVWATDIAALAVGRTIGGPKLAPRVSPNKTWAGLIGATCAAAATSAAYEAASAFTGSVTLMAAMGAVAAVVAQGGDLGESFVKRRFGVKNSSGLIPGHGGVFDRVDGLLAVALAVAAWMMIRGPAV
jgi:phosphatidate cytidylyltransferase